MEGVESCQLPACPPNPRPRSAPMRVGAERTSLGSCISMDLVAFEFLSTSQGLGFELLTPWNHPCLLALTDLGPSRKRGLGLGLGPHCAGRDLAVTGLSSSGPGSQAAAAAQDLWGGKWPLLTVAPPRPQPCPGKHRLFGWRGSEWRSEDSHCRGLSWPKDR